MELSPHSLTPKLILFGIRSLIESSSFRPLRLIQRSTPKKEHLRLSLKIFRREPAIPKLDKLFTSYLNSSEDFAQSTGSGLPPILLGVHPGQGKLAWLRVLYAPLRLVFHKYRQMWKRKNQTISRRDDEVVSSAILRRGVTKKSAIISFPLRGGRIFASFFVARRSSI